MFKQIVAYLNSKVMAHRKGKRIWIQGLKPAMAGFQIGDKYSVIETGVNSVEIKLDKDGEFTVSRKMVANKYLPLLCLRLSDHLFHVNDRINCVFFKGVITITIHHEDMARANRESRFVQNLNDGTLREGSLCTGGGISAAATHQAIKDAGATSKLAYVVDAEAKYLSVAGVNNFAIDDDTVFFCSNIEEVDRTVLGSRPVDVLSFSLPCAGLSRSGKSKHKQTPEEHASSTSLFGLYNFLNASNPAVLWSENVKEAKDSPLYVLLKTELVRRGYRITEDVTSNEKTGSLEWRERYWFMAISNGLNPELDKDIFNYQLTRHYDKIDDIRDLEADLDESQWSPNQYLHDKALRDKADGKGFERQLINGGELKIGTIGRHYNKRRSTEPFWVRHDGLERLLSLKEHAAVKQVPYTLIQNVCSTTGHEILGQSIDFMQCYMPMKRLFEKAVSIYRISHSAVKKASASCETACITTEHVIDKQVKRYVIAF